MILCCGEALMDMLPVTAEGGRPAFAPYTGGAVFNTAIALGRLGAKAGLLTGLSSDVFGDMLRTALAESNVDASLARISDRPTTLAFVHMTNGQARYSFFDENSAGRMMSPEDMPALPDRVSTLFFGGISLACEPSGEAYAALLAREGDARAVMIDPNIRPGFIADEERYRDRLGRMLARADLVKISDEDLNWWCPSGMSQTEKIGSVLAYGPRAVILTLGERGSIGFLADGRRVAVPATPARVTDTVGAGDTFNAGVLAKLSAKGPLSKSTLSAIGLEDLAEAMAYGGRVAAVTVSRAGANPPWRDEISEG